MLKIFIMAVIFSVEIFTSVVLAKPRVMVLEGEKQNVAAEWSELASEFVEENLFSSGKFDLIMSDKELADFKKKFPEYAGIKMLGADYVVISRLAIKKFKLIQRVDLVEDSVVIWSGEASKNFSATDDWRSVVRRLSDKVMKKFFKALDSGKILLKE